MTVPMSEELQMALLACSQDAAPGMGYAAGGDDAKCVAEVCFSLLDMQAKYKTVRDELTALVKSYEYKDVLAEAAKHVATL